MADRDIQSGPVRLTARDGFSFDAFQATPRSDVLGGVVILQEIFGVTDQLKSVARFYARHGFDSIVPAMFDRVEPGTVVPFDQGERGRTMVMGLDAEKTAIDVEAALKAVDGGTGVSLLGFCWGGGQVLRLAPLLNAASTVSFYGTRLTSFLGSAAKCPAMFHFGDRDDHSPAEVIEAVRTALPDAQVYIYEAGHAFANDARPAFYVAQAAELAHRRTLDFLTHVHARQLNI